MEHKNPRSVLWLVPAILAAAALLTIVAMGWPAIVEGAPPSPLSPEQMRLVVEKEQAKRQAGIAQSLGHAAVSVGPGQPVRQFENRIQLTKAEALARLETAWQLDARYVEQLEREGGRGVTIAQRLKAEYEQRRQELLQMPEGTITLDIPGIELGEHSITFSSFTYDFLFSRKDPINVVFYKVGSSWDVNYDMTHWTRLKWKDAWLCGTWQQVYIWDAEHSGGWDGWRGMDYQLELGASWYCGSPRYHVRLFGSFVRDSHDPGFGYWSITSAHHDNKWHTCTNDWEGAEKKVSSSFRDSYGSRLWFVGSIWTAALGNSGKYDCAKNNGKATIIELNY